MLGLFIDRKLTFNQPCTDRHTEGQEGSGISTDFSQYRARSEPIPTEDDVQSMRSINHDVCKSEWCTGKKIYASKLTKVQNDALRHMSGALRTTLVKALKVDMLIPPMEILLDMFTGGYTIRLHKLKSSNPVIEHLSAEWRQGNPATILPPFTPRGSPQSKRQMKQTQLGRIARKTYRPTVGESIDLFIAPPWQKTANDYNGRLTTYHRCPKGQHQSQRSQEAQEKVYSDGSMWEEGPEKVVKNTG